MTASLASGHAPDNVIVVPWTSAADGSYSETINSKLYGHGTLRKMVTVPSVAAAPTDNYDVTLTNSQGINLLADGATNRGADRDTANTEVIDTSDFGTDQVMQGDLVFAIANAGDAKQGTAYFHFSR